MNNVTSKSIEPQVSEWIFDPKRVTRISVGVSNSAEPDASSQFAFAKTRGHHDLNHLEK
jgi:hypothetical protein